MSTKQWLIAGATVAFAATSLAYFAMSGSTVSTPPLPANSGDERNDATQTNMPPAAEGDRSFSAVAATRTRRTSVEPIPTSESARPSSPDRRPGESYENHVIRVRALNRWFNFIDATNLDAETQRRLAIEVFDWQENRVHAGEPAPRSDSDEESLRLSPEESARYFARQRREEAKELLHRSDRLKQVDGEAHARIAQILSKEQHRRFRLLFMDNGVSLSVARPFEKGDPAVAAP